MVKQWKANRIDIRLVSNGKVLKLYQKQVIYHKSFMVISKKNMVTTEDFYSQILKFQ